MRDFFDRKTFDPVGNRADAATLNTLRQFGRRRFEAFFAQGRGVEVQSTAFQWAMNETEKRSGVFLDLGCGDSADRLMAAHLGFNATGMDLFEPLISNITWCPEQLRSLSLTVPSVSGVDVAERIPFPNSSVTVAISQAMLDLIEPVARESFLREVDRVLAPGGVFCCYMQWLQSGWGFDVQEEIERAQKVWPNARKKGAGFVVTKEIPNE